MPSHLLLLLLLLLHLRIQLFASCLGKLGDGPLLIGVKGASMVLP